MVTLVQLLLGLGGAADRNVRCVETSPGAGTAVRGPRSQGVSQTHEKTHAKR